VSREPILSNGTLGVINHGIGNIRSLTNALDYLDFQYRIITQVHDAANLEAIILPGVGNFGAVMKAIEDSGLKEMLKDHLTAGEPFLGICVGMQVLLQGSSEASGVSGFGVFDGELHHLSSLDSSILVPSIGWKDLSPGPGNLEPPLSVKEAYFTHSYYAQGLKEEEVMSTYRWGNFDIPAHISKGRVQGVQFHPEIGRQEGLNFLRNTLKVITR
jgi:imidazole glycerol phosphate synthase glutamine amidotransferase subunit